MFTKKNAPKDEQKEKEEMKWIPDHKHKQCMRCTKQFSMLNRRHHCRQCGCLVCSDCSKNKWYIQSNDNETKYERVCDHCYKALANNKPIMVNSNPYLQTLSEPNLYSWLMTFEKSWIRSRYPDKYNKYKKQLLQTSNENESKKQKNNKPKPSNANIVSKLTPHTIDKKIEENKQKKQLQKQKRTRNNSTDNSIDSVTSTGKIKPKYKRVQKTKYVSSMEEEKNKTLKSQLILPPKKKIIAKKKKYNPLVVVQTGLLYIRIMEAQGLPDCDRFSQPDGYCVYYVTNNDPLFGETAKYSTKVQHNTYEPEWNEDETIIITNSTGKLVIELWDYDFGQDDDYLGKIEIELSDLFLHFACNQKRHSIIDDWFEVNLTPEWRNHKNKEIEKINRKRKTKTMFQTHNNQIHSNPHCAQLLKLKYERTSRVLQIPDENDRYDTNNLQLTAVYKRLETMPLLSIDDSFCDHVIKGKCYIHLQLKLKASNWGHFISHFDPLLPPPPKKKPFEVNIFYAEINKLWMSIIPIMDESYEVMDILFWTKYIRAAVYLLMYGYCVFNPWFGVFWFQLRVLIFTCTSYVKQTVLSTENSLNGNGKFNLPTILHWLVVCFGIIPTILEQITSKNKELTDKEKDKSDSINENNLLLQKKDVIEEKESGENDKKEEDISMGAFTTIMGNNVIRVSGLKNNLCYYQQLLIWINEMIEYIAKLFDWTFVSITSVIVVILMVSCLLLIIFRKTSFYQYELLLIGSGILAYFSKPIQFIQWFIFGISNWYYKYYFVYNKFQTEIKQSEEYDSDIDEDEIDFDEKESERKTELDDNIMGNNVLFKKNNKSKSNDVKKDMNIIKIYFWKLFNKIIKIIYFICELFIDLIFGLIEFIKPIFDISSNKQNKLDAIKKKNDDINTLRSHSEPMFNEVSKSNSQPKFTKPLLKRVGEKIQSAPITESQPVYLSADALSIGSGRTVKSKNEVDRILKQRNYSSSKSSKMSKIGTMFGFGDSNNNGYVQQSRETKKKKRKKLSKSKTMKKQPTLLRKKTLKRIETAADDKITEMMEKLQKAKSLSHLYNNTT